MNKIIRNLVWVGFVVSMFNAAYCNAGTLDNQKPKAEIRFDEVLVKGIKRDRKTGEFGIIANPRSKIPSHKNSVELREKNRANLSELGELL